MNNKNYIIGMIISLIISFGITFIGSYDVFGTTKTPIEAYRVYLKGETIGLIRSEDELYDYINIRQQSLKDLYNVNNVYIPNDINVVRDITYQENLQSVSEIYNIINEKTPFTIKGYIVKIDKTNSNKYETDVHTDVEEDEDEEKIIYINILNKELFETAVRKTVLAFVEEEDYESFTNETQQEIITVGETIEDLYIEDEVTIKEAYIPVNEKIYLKEDELTKYLLFGANSKMSIYEVKKGDTVEDIAESNKMSVNELLIANPDLKSSSALLYEGQKLTIGVLEPIFTTVEEKHVVADQIIGYKTEYIYDNTKYTGYQEIRTKGNDGVTRVTQKLKVVNGETVTALIANTNEIKPVVNEVVVKGGKQAVILGAGNWGWPTNIPYIISSRYGWRWGRLHAGVDISGTGHGSPIYAAKDGVVTEVKYDGTSGNYVTIKHSNNYYTRYGHMASLSRYVKVGDTVKMGSLIGDMGNTGRSTGTHLHFEIWIGVPYGNSSQSFNPLLFY